MPIYDYRCQHCQVTFTVQAAMNDPAPVQGPQCNGQNCDIHKSLNRVFGQIARANQAPPAPPQVEAKSSSKPSHVCAKYCDQHR